MSIALDICCRILSFTNPAMVALPVTTGVGSCWWPISSRGIIRAAPRLHLTNYAPSYSSIALVRTFFFVVHSTWISPLSVGGVLGGFFLFDNGSLK